MTKFVQSKWFPIIVVTATIIVALALMLGIYYYTKDDDTNTSNDISISIDTSIETSTDASEQSEDVSEDASVEESEDESSEIEESEDISEDIHIKNVEFFADFLPIKKVVELQPFTKVVTSFDELVEVHKTIFDLCLYDEYASVDEYLAESNLTEEHRAETSVVFENSFIIVFSTQIDYVEEFDTDIIKSIEKYTTDDIGRALYVVNYFASKSDLSANGSIVVITVEDKEENEQIDISLKFVE